MTDEEILSAAMEIIRRAGAQPRPARLDLLALWKRWESAHGDLASIGSERGRAAKLLAWRPKDGPHAGARMARRDPMSITAEDIDQWRADQRKRITRRKKPTSAAWRNRCVMLLLRVLNFAVSRKNLPNNPIAGIEFEEEDPASSIVITEETFARIFAALDWELIRAWAILAFESGARKGELHKLCWRQLDFSAGLIHLPGESTKNREARDVEFPARAQEALKALPRVLGCDYVFANPATKRPYDPRWIHERFMRGVIRSGVVGPEGKPPTLHRLRVAYVTLFCDRGGEPTVVMSFSGHKDPSVFLRYRIVHRKARKAAMAQNAAGRAAEIDALKRDRG